MPLYTAPSMATNAASATVDVAGAGTAGFHPSTDPVSDAVMNVAGALTPPAVTTKSFVPLNTWPVGPPFGSLTTRLFFTRGLPFTSPVYTEDRPGPLSENQNSPAGLMAMPHGLTRLGSVIGATPGWSETRLIAWKAPAPAGSERSSSGSSRRRGA